MAAPLKIRLRPVKGDQFEVDMLAGDTVQNLKQRIIEMQPEFTSQIRIICCGRILDDDSMKLKDVGIKPNFPLVIMGSKKRPTDTVEETVAPTQQMEASQWTEAFQRAEASEAPQQPASDLAAQVADEAEAAAPVPERAAEAAIDIEAAAQQLCDMGFERREVEHCLQLAFGNPDRAAEYLMSGIPRDLQGPPGSTVERNSVTNSLTEDFEAIAQLGSTQRGSLMRDTEENMGLGINPVEAMINAARGSPGTLPIPQLWGGYPGTLPVPQLRSVPPPGLQSGWYVQTDSQWEPWRPGVAFRGQPGEAISYRLGNHSYSAFFHEGGTGVQVNSQTGRARPLHRVQYQDAVPGMCGRDQLPAPLDHEIEFLVPGWTNFTIGQTIRSDVFTVGDFSFRLLVFPRGTQCTGGNQLSAFVEAVQQESMDARWTVESVRYQITLINWIDYRASITKVDTHTFSKDVIDRGWHDMQRVCDMTVGRGWLGPDGSVLLRASCLCPFDCALRVGPDYSSQKELGLPSWNSHEPLPTSLLQTLSHIKPLEDLLRPVQEDLDSRQRDSGLLVLLRDLFRADENGASEVRLDPRPVLQALTWHSLNGWDGRGPGELLGELCDGLEKLDFKALFRIELDNYIECCDVDFASVRREPCYAIKLPMRSTGGRSLGGVMDSFREVLAEELLDGENAYEADGHGKQRARKGIRISRLPRVLFLEVSRFSFDMATMQPAFVDTRFEFPIDLTLTEFVADSGAYRLHAVISHDTSLGNYNAHVRSSSESGQPNKWVKYTTDGLAVPCSEFSAVTSKYGGNKLKLWNYFAHDPQTLRAQSCPTSACKEAACTLVYVSDAPAQGSEQGPQALSLTDA